MKIKNVKYQLIKRMKNIFYEDDEMKNICIYIFPIYWINDLFDYQKHT